MYNPYKNNEINRSLARPPACILLYGKCSSLIPQRTSVAFSVSITFSSYPVARALSVHALQYGNFNGGSIQGYHVISHVAIGIRY